VMQLRCMESHLLEIHIISCKKGGRLSLRVSLGEG
jgi:hypothetical protein